MMGQADKEEEFIISNAGWNCGESILPQVELGTIS